jgi:hypothetical protein
MTTFDLFISHASEDKESFVAPLAHILREFGVNVWYDEFSLRVGDSLARSIDKGLVDSKFGVVVLSKAFCSKPWPQYELDGLTNKEIGRDKVILPIWHDITRDEVLQFSPTLAGKLALHSNLDMQAIALSLIEVVRPDLYKHRLRTETIEKIERSLLDHAINVAPGEIPPEYLIASPPLHEDLPEALKVRIKVIYFAFPNLAADSLERAILSFRRETSPEREVEIWERMTAAFLHYIQGKNYSKKKKIEVAQVLLLAQDRDWDHLASHPFKTLSSHDIKIILRCLADVVPNVIPDKKEDWTPEHWTIRGPPSANRRSRP